MAGGNSSDEVPNGGAEQASESSSLGGIDSLSDDLRSAAFTCAAASEGCPLHPLGVLCGSSGAEESVTWLYPRPRLVTSIFLNVSKRCLVF